MQQGQPGTGLTGEPRRLQILAVFAASVALLAPLLWSGGGAAGDATPAAVLPATTVAESARATLVGDTATAHTAEATAPVTTTASGTAVTPATEAPEPVPSTTDIETQPTPLTSAEAALSTATALASTREAEEAAATVAAATADARAAATATQAARAAATQTADAEATQAADTEAVQTADAEATQAADTEAVQAADAQATQAADAEATQAADTEAVQTADAAATQTADAATAAAEAQTSAQAETPQADTESAPDAAGPAATTAEAAEEPTATAAPVMAAPTEYGSLVLGNYFVWYDSDGWSDCNISNGDQPSQPYGSDDPAAIRAQIETAIGAGLDGFVSHWYAPGERTDANFATLLAQSQGTNFQSTIMFLRHIWPGTPAATADVIAESLRYIMTQYSGNPSFLHAGGKPVIFFTDMYRVSGTVSTWQWIRDQVDPNREALWIAEGLDASYLSVFDGLYVYKISHATSPQDYAKASRWAANVQQWETTTGQTKLWIATISPGYDDLRAGCRPDVRVYSSPHKMDRSDGAYYQATYDAAVQSAPDWLFVQSYNEWVEGTYIESSVQYGDRYLQMTRSFAEQFKAR